jgi:tRNA1Val (adenine37-N6)-methyltransferase
MPNDHFEFKQFKVIQSACAQKVSTDACLFGAWVAMHVGAKQHVLDIGAGTGLLMLMLAKKSNAEIDGIEIAEDCAIQAKLNIQDSPWSHRLFVIHADARTHHFGKKYDLVISNPPFYENQLRSPDAEKNLAWHSHELTIAELTTLAFNLLSGGGIFCILLPYSRKKELLDLASKQAFHAEQILTVKHTRNHQAGRCMFMFSKQAGATVEKNIDIRNEDGSYSDSFIELLRDYYLFL